MSLHPYVVHDGEPQEVAVLVFAHTAQEARKVGFDALTGFDCSEWIDVRAKRLRKHEGYLMGFRQSDEPHCIESMPVCPRCEKWGAPPVGDGCANCEGES